VPLAAQRVQGFERLEDLLATPEEDRRVRFLKGQEAGIRGPFGIPNEHILRIESTFQETAPEPTIAVLGLGREIDVLNVAEDPPAWQGCTLTGKIALPRSRACTSSAKHHLDASQLGVSSAITAWHWRSCR
jgi:hypothetical protein